LIDGIFNNIAQFSDSPFYTAPVSLCLVEDCGKATEFHEAMGGDSWMVSLEIKDLPPSAILSFQESFPKHIYTDEVEGVVYCWEWVSQ
jgi:hypothetical protein